LLLLFCYNQYTSIIIRACVYYVEVDGPAVSAFRSAITEVKQCWSRLHFQSLAPSNPHWTCVVGYGPFSLSVIHKEDLCSGMMIMMMIYIHACLCMCLCTRMRVLCYSTRACVCVMLDPVKLSSLLRKKNCDYPRINSLVCPSKIRRDVMYLPKTKYTI
jgi:hypothetical protein